MGRKVNFLLFICLIIVAMFVGQAGGQTTSPRDLLKQYFADLQRNPNDQGLREKIIKLALEIKPPPAVPEEAERHMARGAAAIRGAKDTKDFEEAAAEFERATLAAPWLADAYYNLGVAKDKAGDYAGALRSLKLYLLAAPDAPDAKSARSLIYEIEYREEKAEKEKEIAKTRLKEKYIEGGAQRVTKGFLPGGPWGVEGLYGYRDSHEEPYYPNVFRMANGKVISIILVARANNGVYAGDGIGIYDLTSQPDIWGDVYNPGDTRTSEIISGFSYEIQVSSLGPNAVVRLRDRTYNSSVTLPLDSLYRWRAISAAWRTLDFSFFALLPEYVLIGQGGSGFGYLFFLKEKVLWVSTDIGFNPRSLVPTFVVLFRRADGTMIPEVPLGDSGLVARIRDGELRLERR